jgi:twinkle protein
MPMLAELLLQRGICLAPGQYRNGSRKLLCPQCSHARKHRRDKCLSVTIQGGKALWNCHNCSWSGAVSEHDDFGAEFPKRRRSAAPSKPASSPGPVTPDVLRWLADRGISEATARRNKIGAVRHFIPALKGEVACIAFPYFRGGELINIKYRALSEKAFSQVKDAEKILYGLDDIADAEEVVIVEGEPDKLACNESGIWNIVSVPDALRKRLRRAIPTPMTQSSPTSPLVRSISTGRRSSSRWMPISPAMRSLRNWRAGWGRSGVGACAGPMPATCSAKTLTRPWYDMAQRCCANV